MFKRNTLFILGAGASAELGLPLGTELAAIIGKKMDIRFEDGFTGDGDLDLFNNVTRRGQFQGDEYLRAAWLIRDGIRLAPSIDDFLDLHRSNQVVNLYVRVR